MFRDIVKRRLEKGPVLRRLREEFFKATTQILDSDQFLVKLRDDLRNLKSYCLIISPFLNKNTVDKFCNFEEVKAVMRRGGKIIVVTRPPNRDNVEDPKDHDDCIKVLRGHGVKVVENARVHFKSVIIDDSIIYIGSINPLSIVTVRYVPADYMLRFESEALVYEIIEKFPEYEEWFK
jgi:hypothetical protein